MAGRLKGRHAMRYHVTHRIIFRNGTETAPYRLLGSFKTVRGALRAGERHAAQTETHYDRTTIATHALVVVDADGRFITNEAC